MNSLSDPAPVLAPSSRSTLVISISALLVLAVFVGPLDIATGDPKMTVGMDWKVAVKLLVYGLATLGGFAGVLTSSAVRQTLGTLPAVAVILILLLAGMATPIATSGTSLPTALVNFGSLMFIITALLTLRLHGIGLAVLAGVTITTVVALVFWFCVPAYGVFPELLADGLIVNRLGGTSHPNGTGRTAVLGFLLAAYFYRTGTLASLSAGTLAALFALAAYLSWSRTAIVAGMAGIVILYLDRICTRSGVLAVSFAVLCGLGALSATYALGKEDQLTGKILSRISKSGQAEEITSGTGRSVIWSKAISLIATRPVIGHGFNAAPSLMFNHSQATHNAVLHATLAAGVGGGILMLSLMLWLIYQTASSDALLIRSLAAFVVIASLAEDAVLETFPGPVTIIFLICCLYPVRPQRPVINPGEFSQSRPCGRPAAGRWR